MRLAFRLAYKNLIGAGLRTWLNMIVLSISFIVIIWHKGLIDGWDNQARHDMIGWETGGGQYWQQQYDPYDPFTLADSHAAIPTALQAKIDSGNLAPILITQGTLYPSGRMQTVLIRGIEPGQHILNLPTHLLTSDSTQITALVGRKMATDNRISTGDVITLRWRDVHGTFDAADIKIAGIFNTNVPTVDMGQVWISLPLLQHMMMMPGEATLLVKKDDASGAVAVPGWKFKDKEVLLKTITEVIKMKSTSGFMIYGILMLLAMLAIFDTQVLSIFRRQKEIGTFIALGMTKGQVIGLFTLEGTMVSFLAAILSAIYGIPLLALQAVKGLSIPGSNTDYGLAMADKIFPVYSAGLVAGTVVLILLTTTLVSYLPSRKIAKMKPTEALRGKLQ